jgi:hypothetical protein
MARPRMGRSTDTYTIFVSSSDEAKVLRQRAGTIVDLFNRQLAQARSPIRLETDLWEDTSAHKVPAGKVNDEFVRRALESDLTIVLLMKELRPGTKAELNAVMDDDSTELAVLWFKPKSGKTGKNLLAQIKRFKNDKRVFINEFGDWESDDAWLGLFRAILWFFLKILTERES